MNVTDARLERSKSGRARCLSCELAIGANVVRVVAETSWGRDEQGQRYAHVECFVQHERTLAQRAFLNSPPELRDEAVTLVDDPAFVATVMTSPTALPAKKTLHVPPSSSPVDLEGLDGLMLEVLEKLEETPHDRHLLAVLGDALAQRGSLRGELIGLEAGDVKDAGVATRVCELRAALTPTALELRQSSWGIGFLQAVKLAPYHDPSKANLGALFSHPSMRLLTELSLHYQGLSDFSLKFPVEHAPKSVRTLNVEFVQPAPLGELSALPRLERLRLTVNSGAEMTEVLAHASLQSLTLTRLTPTWLAQRQSLPRLRRLTLEHLSARVLPDLVKGGWFEQLEQLKLVWSPLSDGDVTDLSRALAGRRLKKLAVSGVTLTPESRERLLTLAEEVGVDVRTRHTVASRYRHLTHPEWGTGEVVKRRGDKVDLKFESGAVLTFKVGAAVLEPID